MRENAPIRSTDMVRVFLLDVFLHIYSRIILYVYIPSARSGSWTCMADMKTAHDTDGDFFGTSVVTIYAFNFSIYQCLIMKFPSVLDASLHSRTDLSLFAF